MDSWYGGLREYSGGLKAWIGAPDDRDPLKTIYEEHCMGAEADAEIYTSNYGVTTTIKKVHTHTQRHTHKHTRKYTHAHSRTHKRKDARAHV